MWNPQHVKHGFRCVFSESFLRSNHKVSLTWRNRKISCTTYTSSHTQQDTEPTFWSRRLFWNWWCSWTNGFRRITLQIRKLRLIPMHRWTVFFPILISTLKNLWAWNSFPHIFSSVLLICAGFSSLPPEPPLINTLRRRGFPMPKNCLPRGIRWLRPAPSADLMTTAIFSRPLQGPPACRRRNMHSFWRSKTAEAYDCKNLKTVSQYCCTVQSSAW